MSSSAWLWRTSVSRRFLLDHSRKTSWAAASRLGQGAAPLSSLAVIQGSRDIPERRLQQLPRTESLFPQIRYNSNGVKVPKGFKNFFPKGGGVPPKKKPEKNEKKTSATSTKEEKSSSTQTKQSSSFQSHSGNPFGSGGHQNKKGNDRSSDSGFGLPNETLALLFVLWLIVEFTNADKDGSGAGGSKELTWAQVYPLLENDVVERVVVVNQKMARVILKDNVTNEQVNRLIPSSSRGGTSSSSTLSSSSLPKEWNDGTVMELGDTSSEASSSSSSTSRNATGAMSMVQRQRQAQGSDTLNSKRPKFHFYIGSVESLETKLNHAQHLLNRKPRDYVAVQYVNETNWALELIKVSPALVMMGLLLFMVRGRGAPGGAGGGGMGGMFQIGKSNAKKITKEEVNVTFANVAGCNEAKKEIMEFVDFLQDASQFTKLGAKIPKGALLCGPPGTGKTLLARAVAGEAHVPFYSISGSDFIEMFVGVGPSRVRDLFKEARANAPCIVFIDEIDAVGRQRGRGGFSGGNDERENTLNQLLVEMDGFSPTTGVVVLAGTNRVDILDQALTRPGRFDRQIQVDKPDLEGRKDIFMVHLQGITLESDPEDIAGRLAGLTPGFAGADIANICNEAAIVAARRKGESVTMEDFEKATDRIIGGLESNKIMSSEERSIVAHHEAGHAVTGWFLEHADPLVKVTIIPRSSGALGFAQYLPKETFLRTQDQIMDIVCMALAGRAAEEVFFGSVTTGASDDLKRVTQLVYSTIQVYGMNSRVGQLAFPQDNSNGMPGDKPYSDATAEAMDEEARAIVDAAYQRTLDLVREKKDEIEKVAATLLDKETINHDDIQDLLGPRPFEGDKLYKEFVSGRQSLKPEETVEEEAEETVKDEGAGLSPGLA